MQRKTPKDKMDHVEENLSNEEKLNWESECCNASALGELSPEWFEIRKGGNYQKLRQGVCSACSELSHFVEEPNN